VARSPASRAGREPSNPTVVFMAATSLASR
jgi:hypothetical protein